MFKRIIRTIDQKIYELIDPPEHHCDGCGEVYPAYMLTYIQLWDGTFCKRCTIYEGVDEYEEDA